MAMRASNSTDIQPLTQAHVTKKASTVFPKLHSGNKNVLIIPQILETDSKNKPPV